MLAQVTMITTIMYSISQTKINAVVTFFTSTHTMTIVTVMIQSGVISHEPS